MNPMKVLEEEKIPQWNSMLGEEVPTKSFDGHIYVKCLKCKEPSSLARFIEHYHKCNPTPYICLCGAHLNTEKAAKEHCIRHKKKQDQYQHLSKGKIKTSHPELPKPREGQHFKYVTLIFHVSVTAPMVAQTICNNDQIIKRKASYLQQLINSWALDKTGNLTKEQVDGKIKSLMDEIQELKTQNYKDFMSLPSDYRPKRE